MINNILIVEDEPLAAAQLAGLIMQILPQAKIVAVCDTIKSTVEWIESNPAPDLALFDIQLGDGCCFDIFEQCSFSSPTIFTTAFSKYAIQAFKVNSIDYILKPINKIDLEQAIAKFEQLQSQHKEIGLSPSVIKQIASSIGSEEYKERFIVKVGTHLRRVDTKDINYFYSYEKATYIKCSNGKEYLIDYSLEHIETLVSPTQFFRINRKYIVALSAINDVLIYSSTRLKLHIEHGNDDIFVARDRVKVFKQWLEGEYNDR